MESTLVKQETTKIPQEKLWNQNFLLLWQGLFVSNLGDVIYQIALGFWVLAFTGSTALMGTLMAASALPRILIAPFAGVLVDRSDRKKMLVWMDFIRGIVIVFVGVAAFSGFIRVWMVFTAGIILGICGAFFNPAVQSSIPDIVPKSMVVKANSFFGMIMTGANVLGNPIAGFLYQTFGAPLMFLLNGLSYIFSGVTEVFIKIPPIEQVKSDSKFLNDLKEGLSFVWNFRGLRNLLTIAAIGNFFSSMAVILFMPLFEWTEGLGAAKYGIAIAFLTGGMLIGMVLTSIINVAPAKRVYLFVFAIVGSSIFYAIFPFVGVFALMVLMLVLGGILNAVINVYLNSSVQATVPQHMRGKVVALLSTTMSGLTPIAMAVGGIAAEFISIQWLISLAFLINGFLSIPFAFSQSFKRFINFDPVNEKVEDIM